MQSKIKSVKNFYKENQEAYNEKIEEMKTDKKLSGLGYLFGASFFEEEDNVLSPPSRHFQILIDDMIMSDTLDNNDHWSKQVIKILIKLKDIAIESDL